MLVAVLSDSHGPRFWKQCPLPVARRLAGVELILHAGDVCVPAVLDELETFAPVQAVRGNNDGDDIAARGAPQVWTGTLDGLAVAMVHDSGPAAGRGPRLRARFPHARLVVFGHSHVPWHVDEFGQLAFNPGSPTNRRRQPHGTMGLLEIRSGEIVGLRHEVVD